MATYEEFLKSQGISDESMYNNAIQDELRNSYANLGGDAMSIPPITTDTNILGSISGGLGAIKGWAKPIADLTGGFAAIGGYNEAKKNNKIVRATGEQNLKNAQYNMANKVAFDNIMKNPNIGLGKVNVS
jgi:hypothetical protein